MEESSNISAAVHGAPRAEGKGRATAGTVARLLRWLYRELVLRWNLERSHAVIAIGYGANLWIAQTFASAPGTFGTMERLARTVAPAADPEAWWGSMMIIVGASTALGIVTGNVPLRRLAGFVRAALWLLMAACFVTSNPRSPAGVLYVTLAWAAFTRALNARRVAASQPE